MRKNNGLQFSELLYNIYIYFLYSLVVGDVPDIVTPEALKQIPPSGYTANGKAYVIAISPPPKEEVIHFVCMV